MFTSILTALALSAATLTVPTVPTGTDMAAVVRQYQEEAALPGVAVAVTHGDKVLHAAGYGRTPDGESVTEHTVMPVASVSKSFTALAVVQLVERGRIRLDDPVRTHLPEFTMADPRAARITVRHLLDQTSGMSDTTFRSFSGPKAHTLREAVESMRDATLASDPGTKHEYHNPNFQVAARLVEVVAGVPFEDHLRANVFAPLGMSRSSTANTERDLPPSGRGHLKVLGVPVALPEPPAFGNGSGGVLSTAHDMAAWLIAQNNRGRGPHGTIATPESIARTHTPASGDYALGWFVGTTPAGAPLIAHGGDLFTSTAYQALLPASGHGVAVMANTGMRHGDAQALGARIIALLEGRRPDPVTDLFTVDAVLLAPTLAVGALAVRGVARARRWAGKRSSLPLAAARLLPLLLPLLLLLTVHRVVGFLYRGRDVARLQVPYLYPTFTVLLAIAALGGVAVAVARAFALLKR
ncbi:serine hydrolase domain-containing protein [Saccharothrix mutabilis subsp. mutabilis]|uniref:Serine hydrolase domain-containing protein n=1 Tax=Saccharothrix mutabilis subsp. mutabilis TaxID=66855 RepID=A0ABN0UFR4_9PSEU